MLSTGRVDMHKGFDGCAATVIDDMHTFMHTLIMRVTFDPKKAARNLKKHGVSLADAALIFDGFSDQ